MPDRASRPAWGAESSTVWSDRLLRPARDACTKGTDLGLATSCLGSCLPSRRSTWGSRWRPEGRSLRRPETAFRCRATQARRAERRRAPSRWPVGAWGHRDPLHPCGATQSRDGTPGELPRPPCWRHARPPRPLALSPCPSTDWLSRTSCRSRHRQTCCWWTAACTALEDCGWAWPRRSIEWPSLASLCSSAAG